jgi:hypothetical protein
MAKLISFSAATFLLFGSAGAAFAESASFETNGFPISLHQAQVTGLSDIRETAPGATLAVDGMPASPHQLAVLSPRKSDDGTRRVARTEHAASTPVESAAR